MVLTDETVIRCIHCNHLKDYKSGYEGSGFPPFCCKCWQSSSRCDKNNEDLKIFLRTFNWKLCYLENPSPWANDYCWPVKEESLKNRPKKDLANEAKKEIEAQLKAVKEAAKSATSHDERQLFALEYSYLATQEVSVDTFVRKLNK